MGRFAALARGVRSTRPIVLSYGGADVALAVRPLSAAEEAEALALGRAYAVGKGVASPQPKERLYEIGYMAHTLLLGCVDAEAPAAPFFSSVAEILDNLDTDRIAYLYEQQQAWQDHCAPRAKEMGAGEFIAYVLALAEEGGDQEHDPLATLRPSLRLSWERTLARQYTSLLGRNSLFGSDGEVATSTTPNEGERPALPRGLTPPDPSAAPP